MHQGDGSRGTRRRTVPPAEGSPQQSQLGQGQNQADESEFGFHDIHCPVAIWKELPLHQESQSPKHHREDISGQKGHKCLHWL